MRQEGPFQILFVEDQVRHQKVYATAIEEQLPVNVVFATNGDDALKLVTGKEPPELIVLDLDIPGASGETVLERVRGAQGQRYIPVIILTGQGGTEKQMELLDKGADDFLEKGMPPEILIARLRTQMRHKLAIDRLEGMALDRDLFAAGVLSDIGGIRGAIGQICRSMRGLVQEPVKNRETMHEHLNALSSVASKLGSYAADVIQTVRDTSGAAEAAPQTFEPLLAWVLDVLTSLEPGAQQILTFQTGGALAPVVADPNFLRLALLNTAQFGLRHGGGKAEIVVSQTSAKNLADPMQRAFVTTRFAVPGASLPRKELARLFAPGAASEEGGLGLTLVSKVLAKMGGRAYAENRTDQPGVVIALELPLAPS